MVDTVCAWYPNPQLGHRWRRQYDTALPYGSHQPHRHHSTYSPLRISQFLTHIALSPHLPPSPCTFLASFRPLPLGLKFNRGSRLNWSSAYGLIRASSNIGHPNSAPQTQTHISLFYIPIVSPLHIHMDASSQPTLTPIADGWYRIMRFEFAHLVIRKRCYIPSLYPHLYPLMMNRPKCYHWITYVLLYIFICIHFTVAYIPLYLQLLLMTFPFLYFRYGSPIYFGHRPPGTAPRCGLIGVAASLYRWGGCPRARCWCYNFTAVLSTLIMVVLWENHRKMVVIPSGKLT